MLNGSNFKKKYGAHQANTVFIAGNLYIVSNTTRWIEYDGVANEKSYTYETTFTKANPSGQECRIDGDKVGFVGTVATIVDYGYTGNELLKDIGNKSITFGAKTGKVLNSAEYFAAGASTSLDYKSMKCGEISGSIFSYRTVGTGIGVGVGIYVGAVPGTIVGGAFWAGEQMYNGIIFSIDKLSQLSNDFNRAVGSGTWHPIR